MMSPLLILRSGGTKGPPYLYGMRRLFVAMMNNSGFCLSRGLVVCVGSETSILRDCCLEGVMRIKSPRTLTR